MELHTYRVDYIYEGDDHEYTRYYDATSADEASTMCERAAAVDGEDITIIRVTQE